MISTTEIPGRRFPPRKSTEARHQKLDARLENILANAVVGEAKESHGIVEQGTIVRLTMNGSELEFLLGSAEIAEGSDIDVYSPDSPIGTAIMGAKVGDKVSFFAPNGKEREIEILEVKNFLG